MNISKIRNHYRTGDISVYPLVLVRSDYPRAGKVKLVSAKKWGDRWGEIDHYGAEPFKNWNDVFRFMEEEILKISKLNALSYVSREEVKAYWDELNTPISVINLPDPDNIDFLEISNSGIESKINLIDGELDKPRYDPGYWEAVLTGWKSSLDKMKEEFEKGLLISL